MPLVPKSRIGLRARGFTLAEVLVSASIAVISIGGIMYGYVMSAQRAEWSSYALAAQSLARQGIEQARAAKWDLESTPAVDEVVTANFPEKLEILDIPVSGDNVVYASVSTTITNISSSPPLKRIEVDCVWFWSVGNRWFTNTVVTCRAPDS